MAAAAAAATADTRKFMKPIVSKAYCSASDEVVFVVRRRPHVVNGGGFVVTDCSNHKLIFRVDGCGIVGRKGELILRDGDGHPLLLIRQKGGILQALSINKQWRGYAFDYEGVQKLVFSVREPNSCFPSCTDSDNNDNAIRVSTNPTGGCRDWDYEVKGYFSDRNCTILDSLGNNVAQIGTRRNDVEKDITSKDVYPVTVNRGIDQAFVFGVIAVLDYIHHESTRC